MKKEFLPYTISRAILSTFFAVYVSGFSWQAGVIAIVIFGLFLLYLHSGWFKVDMSNPIAPLRRDQRGELIQRKALIVSLIAGFLTYYVCSQLFSSLGFVLAAGSAALVVAILAYFATQFVLFMKA
mgnify:CR=1 FL=1